MTFGNNFGNNWVYAFPVVSPSESFGSPQSHLNIIPVYLGLKVKGKLVADMQEQLTTRGSLDARVTIPLGFVGNILYNVEPEFLVRGTLREYVREKLHTNADIMKEVEESLKVKGNLTGTVTESLNTRGKKSFFKFVQLLSKLVDDMS